jgi:hypothetical protein
MGWTERRRQPSRVPSATVEKPPGHGRDEGTLRTGPARGPIGAYCTVSVPTMPACR